MGRRPREFSPGAARDDAAWPAAIDYKEVRRYLETAGHSVSEDHLTCDRIIRGAWDASFVDKLSKRNVVLRTRRFCSDGRSVVTWHAMSKSETYSRERPMAYVYVFASPDESVMGRCLTVQGTCGPSMLGLPCDVQHTPVFVTLFDSRLTTSRLIDVAMRALASPNSHQTFTNKEALRGQVQHSLANVVSAWPSAPRPLAPDLEALLRINGPHPVRRIGPTAVSVAGGCLVIAAVDSDTARRCVLEDEMVDSLDDADESTHTAIKVVADGVLSACGGGPLPRHTIFVAQQVGTDCYWLERTSPVRSALMLSGVPAAQIASIANTLSQDAFGEFGDPDVLLGVNDEESLLRDRQVASERAEAAAVIARIMSDDRFVKRIKERVWRPGGALVQKMFANERDDFGA